jgi:hypothetical protein
MTESDELARTSDENHSMVDVLKDILEYRSRKENAIDEIADLRTMIERLPVTRNGAIEVFSPKGTNGSREILAAHLERDSLEDESIPFMVISAVNQPTSVEIGLHNSFKLDDPFLDYTSVKKGPKKGMVDIKDIFKDLLRSGYTARVTDKEAEDGEMSTVSFLRKVYDLETTSDREMIVDVSNILSVLAGIIEKRNFPRRKRKKLWVYSNDDFSKDTGLSMDKINDLKSELARKKNIIFQGPPGTGKTYIAERLAWNFIEGTNGKTGLVQFHPSYTYEDFVQGFRPVLRNKMLSYELQDGTFKAFCHEASKNPDDPFVMLIDEINRANISRIFGELMHLLEYRNKDITLEASGERFRIPENVYLIGTMNTADRSIAIVDYALRRRFTFINLYPDYDVLRNYLEAFDLPHKSLIEVLKDINGEINDPNYFLGISYFMHDGRRLKADLSDIWKGEIEPYLEEYFYDTPEKSRMYRFEVLKDGHLKEWN